MSTAIEGPASVAPPAGAIFPYWVGEGPAVPGNCTRQQLADEIAATFTKSFAEIRADLIGLTGGGATKLDGLTTATGGAYAVRDALFLFLGSGAELWVLTSGTSAEDVPNGIVRPDDYAAVTNEKVWIKQL